MKAGQTTLKPLIEGQKQYRVPIFQRPYVWDGPEVLQLWEDMTVQYRGLRPPSPGEAARPSRSTHFLGSFVLAPIAGPARGVTPYVVVDGQQRLTTLLLALAALRDVQAKSDTRAYARFNQLYLRNEFAEGLDRYKLLPAQSDREPFVACIDGEAPDNSAGRPGGDATQCVRPLPRARNVPGRDCTCRGAPTGSMLMRSVRASVMHPPRAAGSRQPICSARATMMPSGPRR